MAECLSFEIHYPLGGGPPTVGSNADPTQKPPKIGKKATDTKGVDAYFIEVNGKEPKCCHMIIRSRVPVTIGMPSKGLVHLCVGGDDCKEPSTKCDEITISDLPAGTQLRKIEYCRCTLPSLAGKGPPRLRKRRDRHGGRKSL